MTDPTTREIRDRLDEDLSLDAFERASPSTEEATTRFFRELFVQVLGFDGTPSPGGDGMGRTIPVHEWPASAGPNATRVVAGAGDFRVVYVELAALTRPAERAVVRGLARSDRTGDWAVDGTYLAIFHAGGDAWHLVTPYEDGPDDVTTGRPVLRRYALGEGATHRTVASALAGLRTSEGPLAARVDEAFRVEAVAEAFYEDYERAFETFTEEFRADGLEADAADRYAHLVLTRLLCCYYLQQTGRMGGRTDFVRWFVDRYAGSGREDAFHETWLSTLFLEGLNRSAGDSVEADLPADVAEIVSGLADVDSGIFRPTDLDRRDVHLSDAVLGDAIRGFLDRYDFTVLEATPHDADVAVDPSMLGTVYESFVAGQDHGEAGTVYTPRVEVDFVCRIAVYEQLRRRVGALDDGDRWLVAFVFGEPGGRESVGGTDPSQVEGVDPGRVAAVLRDLRIVDPACGSGAFLVGMHQVLADLHRKLGRSDDGPGDRLLTENLYGVDVADWAVRVARFRLRLSVLEGSEGSPGDGEVLPTADLDVTTGDSLVRPTGTDDGHPVDGTRHRPGPGDTTEFVWDREYPAAMRDGGFDVVVGNPPYVRHEDILDQRLDSDRLEAMDPADVQALQSEYKRALGAFVERRFGTKPYGTSDLYLYFFFRAIDVLAPGGTLSFVTSNSWLDVAYGVPLQEALLAAAEVEYVFESRVRRTFADAAVNTIVSVVNNGPRDRLTTRTEFVASSTGYDRFVSGRTLESVLVGGSNRTRALSFRGEELTVRSGDGWRSVGLSAAALWRLGGGCTSPNGGGVGTDSGEAVVGSDGGDTEAAGGVLPRGDYRSGKWGKFVRAPTVFFELTGGTTRGLSRLGDECVVRRGTRTGANQFFYLPSTYYDATPDGDTLVLESTGDWPDDEYETHLEIPREYWMHRAGDGWVPNHVVKTPRSFDAPIVDVDSLEPGGGLRYVLLVDEPESALPGDVAAYVRWGEEYDPGRDDLGRTTTPFPSSASDRGIAWYDLTADLRRGDLLPMKTVDTRHAYWFPARRTWIDDRLHGIEVPGDEVDRRFLAGVLNSTYGALSCEVNGRANLGHGALDVATDDHGRTLVPPLDAVDEDLKSEIAAAFERLGARTVTSVFDELGTADPDDLTLDAVAADRLALDRLVVRDLLGFDGDVLRRVYEGTLELVVQRVDKADSV